MVTLMQWKLGNQHIPVRLASSWWLFAAFVALSQFSALRNTAISPTQQVLMALSVPLLYFVAVFLHEAAHAVVGHRVGMAPTGVELNFFGGVTQFEGRHRPAWADVVTSIAGPLMNVVLGLVAWAAVAFMEPSPVRWALSFAVFLNFGLAVLNMLPLLPFDGGLTVVGLVRMVSGSHLTGVRVGGWLSVILSGAALLGVAWYVLTRGIAQARQEAWLIIVIVWFAVMSMQAGASALKTVRDFRRPPQ